MAKQNKRKVADKPVATLTIHGLPSMKAKELLVLLVWLKKIVNEFGKMKDNKIYAKRYIARLFK